MSYVRLELEGPAARGGGGACMMPGDAIAAASSADRLRRVMITPPQRYPDVQPAHSGLLLKPAPPLAPTALPEMRGSVARVRDVFVQRNMTDLEAQFFSAQNFSYLHKTLSAERRAGDPVFGERELGVVMERVYETYRPTRQLHEIGMGDVHVLNTRVVDTVTRDLDAERAYLATAMSRSKWDTVLGDGNRHGQRVHNGTGSMLREDKRRRNPIGFVMNY